MKKPNENFVVGNGRRRMKFVQLDLRPKNWYFSCKFTSFLIWTFLFIYSSMNIPWLWIMMSNLLIYFLSCIQCVDKEIKEFWWESIMTWWCRDVRLLCLFRFKVWWMIPRIGNSGSDIPIETQMLLLESSKGADSDDPNETCYILFLPVLDGEFRSSLQGNASDELEFCVESGNSFKFKVQRFWFCFFLCLLWKA